MASRGDIALEVLLLVFVSCGFVGCVGCTTALIKKYYNEYVLNLPTHIDPITSMYYNLQGRYVNAVATIEPAVVVEPCRPVEPFQENGRELDIIAVEVPIAVEMNVQFI